MKIIKKDLKNGKMVLRIEVQDDLYYLADIIDSESLVTAKTKRRVELDRKISRPERIDKRTMSLSIKVQEVELDKNVDRLRIMGKIIKGPETIPIGDYHTLNLKPGMTLTIEKETWNASDLVKVKDSVKTIKAKILLVAIEEGSCSLGLLRNYGVQRLGNIGRSISGKDELEAKASEMKQFFQEVLEALEKEVEGLDRIIIAGPAFTKDNFYKFLKEKRPELAKKTLVESVSMSGEKGLQEIVKRGIIEKVVKESKIQSEIRELNKLFEEISKDSGLASYGLSEVRNAINMGAVNTLLVSNSMLKKAKIEKNKELEDLISDVENMKGSVVLVSEEHELGKQLSGLGGIAALLRYKV